MANVFHRLEPKYRRLRSQTLVGLIVLVAAGCQSKPEPVQARGPEDPGFVVGFGHVDVEGGAIPLAAPLAGRVVEVFVKEGELVARDQPILTLDVRAARLAVEETTNLIAKAKIALKEAERGIAQHQLQIKRCEASIKAARSNLASRQREFERMESLSKSGAVGEETLEPLRASTESLSALLDAEEVALDELRLVDPNLKVDLARHALEDAERARESAELHLDQHALRAPSQGIVLRLQVAPGQLLGNVRDVPPVWFCPEAPRIVRCEIQQELARLVKKEMPVEFRAEMSNLSLGRGEVLRCAEWIAKRRSLLDEPFEVNDVRTLECLISIDTPWEQLKIGERVRVIIDTRSPLPEVRAAR